VRAEVFLVELVFHRRVDEEAFNGVLRALESCPTSPLSIDSLVKAQRRIILRHFARALRKPQSAEGSARVERNSGAAAKRIALRSGGVLTDFGPRHAGTE